MRRRCSAVPFAPRTHMPVSSLSRRRRRENLGQAKTLLAQGRTQQAREYFVKCVDVTPAMAYQLIKVCGAVVGGRPANAKGTPPPPGPPRGRHRLHRCSL